MSTAAITNFPLQYERYFAVVRATTPELLRKAYRLRFQAYCIENPFEDPEQQIDQCETDKYDADSVHTLLVHRRTGEVAGTSRVILPYKGEFRSLPMGTLLHGVDRRGFGEFLTAQTGEISRFTILKQFRRRYGEERYADAGVAESASDPEISERLKVYAFLTSSSRQAAPLLLEFCSEIFAANCSIRVKALSRLMCVRGCPAPRSPG